MAHLNMHKGKNMTQELHMGRRDEARVDRSLGFTAAQRKRIAAGVLLSYLCYPGVVLAQTVVEGGGAHAPQITQSQNNTTVVNINQASKDGVSRNQYNQFNVGSKGLILNNSTAITQTQLAGYIDGNAALKGQAARIILNEVVSANPSALRGYTEIAGQRAEFILANPNGISCNGCGFINTTRSTLTTGTAQFGANGGLTGFRVEGGQIAIEGQGLNASNVDQLDLLSRTIRINGELWAKQLNLVTGRNTVDHATLAATPLAGTDPAATGIALDVSAIGGMYANVIRMVGTEKGFGVNSQGQMIAEKDFTLAADGRITHSGLVQATQGQLTIQTSDVLDNRGTVSGKNVNVSANTIQNASGAVLAAEQRLDLSATRQLDNAGQVQAANTRIQAESLRNAETGLLAASQQLDITTTQTLSNTGRVQAGNANIKAASVDNAANAVLLTEQALNITAAQQFVNAGRVQAANATMTAGQFNNAASGTVAGDQALSITSAGTLVNQGQLAAVQNLSLSATGALTLAGTTQANEGTLTLQTDAALDNTGTTGGRNVVVTAASVHNSSVATLLAEDTLSITTAGALNNEGIVQATDASITAGSVSNANNALVYADRDLQITSAGAVSNQGAVTAGRNLGLTAQGNVTQVGLLQAIDGDLTLQTSQALNNTGLIGGRNASLSANTLTNSANAVLLADQQLSLTATGQLTNAGGVEATDITVEAGQFTNTKDGLMFAEGALQLTTGGNLENKGALVAQDMTLQARNLNNTSGAVLLALGDADIQVTETLRNASATIEAEGDLHIEAGTLRNEWENFEVKKTIKVESKNESQESSADSTLTVVFTETTTSYELKPGGVQGFILSGGNMRLDVLNSLENKYSTISAGGNLTAQGWNAQSANQSYVIDGSVVRVGTWYLFWGHPECYKSIAATECQLHSKQDFNDTLVTSVTLAEATFSANRNLTVNFGELKNGDKVDALVQNQTASHQGPDRDATLPNLTLGQDGYQLPSSALVKPSNSPNHPYLVETDPRLTSYKTFISSDYILDKLDFDFAETPKRLGDGFVEQRLVRDQLLSQTGFQYLDGYDSLEQQYVGLMENALDQAKALSLSPGVALTPEQIAQLQEPIVWMVLERFETAYGVQTALVPKVYLGHNDNIVLRADGSLMASGGSMSLNVAGGLSNSGTIQSGDALSIETGGDLYNLSGAITAQGGLGLKVGGDLVVETLADGNLIGTTATISGGSISIDVVGDARFTGASLQAQAGLSVLAGGDVEFKALETVTESQIGRNYTKEVEHLTNQLQAGGNLTIKAGGNLFSEGTSFQADGDMALAAKGDVTLAEVVDSSESAYRSRRKTEEHASTTVTGNDLDAGGNLSVRSGGDFVSTASNLSADGTLSLAAEGDVLLYAATERDYSYEKTVSTSGSAVNKKKTTRTSTEETLTMVGNELSGQNIQIQSGGLVHIHASTLDAEQDITLQAENIAVTAGIDQEYERDTKVTKSTFKVKSQDKGSMEQTAVASELNAANIKVLATGGVQITASNLNAEETLAIGDVAVQQQADGSFVAVSGEGTPENLIVDTLALKSESWNEKSEGYRGIAADLMKGIAVAAGSIAQSMDMKAPEIKLGESSSKKETTISQQSSTLSAGQQLVLAAQNNVTLIGAEVSTEGTAVLSAANVTLEAAAETSTSETSHSEHTVGGMGGKLNKDEVSLGGMKEVKTTETMTTTSTTHKGTTLSAGNLAVLATQDVNIVASKVEVEKQAIVQAGGDVNVTGKQDTTSTEKRTEVETTTVAVAVRNAYVDAGMAAKAVVDAAKAVRDADEAFSDAFKRVESGELAKAALKDYEINRQAARANLVQAEIAAAAAIAGAATAASSSMGTGFYVSGSAQKEVTTTSTTQTASTWQGSSIDAGSLVISGQNTTIEGSDITAGWLKLDSDNVLITAGINQYKQETSSSTKSVSASGGSNGSASVSASTSSSKSSSTSLQNVNSTINVGHLESEAESFTLRGAEVVTQTADLNVGSLTVQSLQDTSSSSNSSKGFNVGVSNSTSKNGSSQSVSVGVNKSSGSSEAQEVGNQTQLLITNGANSQITARDTTLIGGLIANATQNKDGTLTDHGKLNLTTETLTVSDLKDKSESEQSGWGFQTSTGRSTSANADGLSTTTRYGGSGSTTVSMSNEGHKTEGETQATLGLGNIKVGGADLSGQEQYASLNRDVNEAQITTLDQQTGGLNAGVTMDNRWLTSSGRDSLLNDQKNLGENSRKAAGGAARDLLRVTGTYSAYEVMFTKDAKMYVLIYNEQGEVQKDGNGVPFRRELTPEETKNLVRSEDGKVYIANNGIMTDQDGAAKNADQFGSPRDGENNIQRTQYFIEYQKSENVFSELVVAGYQKILEGDFWGLTNPTQMNVDMMNLYGYEGLQLDGHSRGTMTIGNAMESVLNSGSEGGMPGLDVNFFGPAYNAEDADQLLARLQGSFRLKLGQDSDVNVVLPSEISLNFQNHAADPVGNIIGWNPSTGGSVPTGSSSIQENLNALTSENSSHNCYGDISGRGACGGFWDGGTPKWNSVIRPD